MTNAPEHDDARRMASRRKRLLALAIGVAVAAVLIAATVTIGSRDIGLGGGVDIDDPPVVTSSFAGGVVVAWGSVTYDAARQQFTVSELELRPRDHESSFPMNNTLTIAIADHQQQVLVHQSMRIANTSAIIVRFDEAVPVHDIATLAVALDTRGLS